MILIDLFFPFMLTIFAMIKQPSARAPPLHYDPHGTLLVKTRFDMNSLIVQPVNDVTDKDLKRSYKVKELLYKVNKA